MVKVTRLSVISLLLLAVGLFLIAVPESGADSKTERIIIQLTLDGVIGPATEDYIERALDDAARHNAELIIIRLDTPGGLDTAMRGIVKTITNSPIPFVTYVAPAGARAASAGTYILYASHIAAMAPGTNVGAATPVQIGGMTPPATGKKDKNKAGDKKQKSAADVNDNAMNRKVVNDAVAYLRSLAQLRGRNQEWAEKAVREAASLPAKEALDLNVIDVIANTVGDLLKQIDGLELTVSGRKRVLKTSGLPLQEFNPDWRSRLLSVVTNPNIAYILMLIGIYGLIFEFSNPGTMVPGTVGAICLLLAMYAFQMLPINYAGMGLILLGVALMVGEAFVPSFGMLGIGGVISFVIGSIILMDTKAPGFGIDIALIATFTVISLLIFVFIVGMAIRARRKPIVSGMEELIGGEAVVLADFDRQGTVAIHSENWRAVSDKPMLKGQRVKVKDVKGLTLQVEALDATDIEKQEEPS